MGYSRKYRLCIDTVFNESNIAKALKIMKWKKPGPGLDEIGTKELESYWLKNRKYVLSSIREGTYIPEMLKLYFKKKPGKKDKRKIAVCTQMDQMLQHCIRMEVEKVFMPKFHKSSFGFIKGKNTKTALKECLNILNDGWDTVVDADIRKFFDSVKHKIVINKLREVTNDEMLITLVNRFLKNPGMVNGKLYHNRIGLPQGSSFSPVFANVVLNELDWYLDGLGIKFVRYADDLVLFCKNRDQATDTLKLLSTFLKEKLSLSLNMDKTSICSGTELEFLGYAFGFKDGTYYLSLSEKIIHKMLDKLKKHLNHKKNKNDYFDILGAFNRGWVNYYREANAEKLHMAEAMADKLEFDTIYQYGTINKELWGRFSQCGNFTTMTLWDDFLGERGEFHG